MRIGTTVLALALVCAAAPDAVAQTCLGRGVGGLAARANVAEAAYIGFETPAGTVEGTEIGAAYWANPRGFLSYSVGYARRFGIEDSEGRHVGRLQLSGELPPVEHLPPGSGVCLTAGISASGAAVSFPLGFAVGLLLPAGQTARFYPYVHPQLVLTEHTGSRPVFPGDDDESLGASRVGIEGGTGFAMGAFVARLRLLGTIQSAGATAHPVPELRAGVEAGIRF